MSDPNTLSGPIMLGGVGSRILAARATHRIRSRTSKINLYPIARAFFDIANGRTQRTLNIAQAVYKAKRAD